MTCEKGTCSKQLSTSACTLCGILHIVFHPGSAALRCSCDQPTVCGTKNFCHYPVGSHCVVQIEARSHTSDAGSGRTSFSTTSRKCVLLTDLVGECPHSSPVSGVSYGLNTQSRTVSFCCNSARYCNRDIEKQVASLEGNLDALSSSDFLYVLHDIATLSAETTGERSSVLYACLYVWADFSNHVFGSCENNSFFKAAV